MERSFRLWIAEVDDVIAEAGRIGCEHDDQRRATLLSRELDDARAVAEQRTLARKSFRFAPSAAVATLAENAIAAVRSEGQRAPAASDRRSPTAPRIGNARATPPTRGQRRGGSPGPRASPGR